MNSDVRIYRGLTQPNKTIRDFQSKDIQSYSVTVENSGYIIWADVVDDDRDSCYHTFIDFESNRDTAIEATVKLVFKARLAHGTLEWNES